MRYSYGTETGEAKAELLMSPRPRIRLTIENLSRNTTSFDIGRDLFPAVEVEDTWFSTTAESSFDHLTDPSSEVRLILNQPEGQPATDSEMTDEMVFWVVNLPPLGFDSMDRSQAEQPFTFSIDGWTWDFQSLSDALQRSESAADPNEYTLTHLCRLRRTKTCFSLSAGLEAMTRMDTLLSFVVGRRVASIVPSVGGQDSRSVLLWGTALSIVDTAQGLRTWCPTPVSESLKLLLPGYWSGIQDPPTEEWLKRAINLFAATNRHASYVDLELIHVASALELLSWVLLVKTTTSLSKGRFERLPLHDTIRLALGAAGISAAIPEQSDSLRSVLPDAADLIVDGPAAIATIRNAMVHPSDKNISRIDKWDGSLYYDALKLALMYTELLILWLVGYDGRYVSRVEGGRPRSVPWKQSQ